MAPSPYAFDRDRKKKNSSPWRLITLFCAIGVLTAAGIYYFYPKNALAPAAAEGEAETKNVAAPSESLEKPPAGATEQTPPDRTKTDGSAAAVSETAEKTAEKTAQEKTETPVEPPVKGKNWTGDAPDELDRPAVAEAKIPAGFAERLAAAQGELAAGNPAKVRDEALQLLKEPGIAFGSAPWRETAALLTRADRLLWAASPATDPGSTVYLVKTGDTLLRVADRFHTTAAALRVPNGIPERSTVVKVGQRLHFTAGPWRVSVSKKYRLLCLYCGEGEQAKLFAAFDVGIGRLNATPTGEFVIYDRCRAKLAPEFGRSFLKLAPAATPDRPFAGLGIHGTDDENSVKRSQSAGCIRLRNDDIDFLYAALPLRSRVTITD